MRLPWSRPAPRFLTLTFPDGADWVVDVGMIMSVKSDPVTGYTGVTCRSTSHAAGVLHVVKESPEAIGKALGSVKP